MSIPAIIARFGGVREMARKGGWPPSTVQSWLNEGVIPARRQAHVLEVAAKHDIKIEAAEFLPAPRPEPGEAA